MKLLLSFLLFTSISAFGAVPSYLSFVGTNGLVVRSNPPIGTIIFDGSGIVTSSGTNATISTRTNTSGLVAAASTNLNFIEGNNMVQRATNTASRTDISIGIKSNLSFFAQNAETVFGTWATVSGWSNVATGDLMIYNGDTAAGNELTFSGILTAPNAVFNVMPGSGSIVAIAAGGGLYRTNASGGVTSNDVINITQGYFLTDIIYISTASVSNLTNTGSIYIQPPISAVQFNSNGVMRGSSYMTFTNGSFRLGSGTVNQNDTARGLVLINGALFGNNNKIFANDNIAAGTANWVDGKISGAIGNANIATANDSIAHGNRSVVGRRVYEVLTQGQSDPGLGTGSKAFVVITNTEGDVTGFFPNALYDANAAYVLATYGLNAGSTNGNIYADGYGDPADLSWAMHPYMILRGATSESQISQWKILRATNEATGTRIWYDSTTNAWGTISHAYSSYSPVVTVNGVAGGNGETAEGVFSSTWGYGSHAEGYITKAWGLASHAQNRETRALGQASSAQGYLTAASGDYSTAMGRSITASGLDSIAIALDYFPGTAVTADHVMGIMGGRVGIGVTNPAALLHVRVPSSVSAASQIYAEGGRGGYGAGISFMSQFALAPFTLTQQAKIVADTTGTFNDAAGASSKLTFWTINANSLTEKVVIRADGKTGIGVASPDAPLTVDTPADNDYIARFKTSDNVSGTVDIFSFSDESVGLYLRGANNVIDNLIRSDGDSYFNGGSVGIGTVAPTNFLDVNGAAGFRTEVIMPGLPTNGTVVAYLGVNAGGRTFLAPTTSGSGGGGAGSFAVNANQFVTNTVLNFKDGALVTNVVLYAASNNGPALTVTGPTNGGTIASFNTNVFMVSNAVTRFGGHQLFIPDNTYDIGVSGATRPRNIYTAGSIFNNPGFAYGWLNTAYIYSEADVSGVIRLQNSTFNGFNRVQLGGTTAAFPALGRTNGDLVVFGADGNFGGTSTNRLHVPGGIVLTNANVAAGKVWTAVGGLGGGTWSNATAGGFSVSGNSNQIPYLNTAGTGFNFGTPSKSNPGFGFVTNGGVGTLFIHADRTQGMGLVVIGPRTYGANAGVFEPSLNMSNRYAGDGTVTQELVKVTYIDVDGGSHADSFGQTWSYYYAGIDPSTQSMLGFAAVRKDGAGQFGRGVYYPSNYTAAAPGSGSFLVPTAGQLGPGGHWLCVSNNSLIDVYSLNGTTIAIKEMSPFPTGATLTNVLYASTNIDFPSVAAGAVFDAAVSIPGAVDGDIVSLGVQSKSVQSVTGDYSAWASNEVVYIRFQNNNLVTAQDPTNGTFKVSVNRFK